MKFPFYYWTNIRPTFISNSQNKRIPILTSIHYILLINCLKQKKNLFYLFLFFYLFSNTENYCYKIISKYVNEIKTCFFQLIIKLKQFKCFLNFLYFFLPSIHLSLHLNKFTIKKTQDFGFNQIYFNCSHQHLLLQSIFSKGFEVNKNIQLFKFNLIIKALICKSWYFFEVVLRLLLKLPILLYL